MYKADMTSLITKNNVENDRLFQTFLVLCCAPDVSIFYCNENHLLNKDEFELPLVSVRQTSLSSTPFHTMYNRIYRVNSTFTESMQGPASNTEDDRAPTQSRTFGRTAPRLHETKSSSTYGAFKQTLTSTERSWSTLFSLIPKAGNNSRMLCDFLYH